MAQSREEKLEEIFLLYDTNKNGSFDLEEFKFLMHVMDDQIGDDVIAKTYQSAIGSSETMELTHFKAWADLCFGSFSEQQFNEVHEEMLASAQMVDRIRSTKSAATRARLSGKMNIKTPQHEKLASRNPKIEEVFSVQSREKTGRIELTQFRRLMSTLDTDMDPAEVDQTFFTATSGHKIMFLEDFKRWSHEVFGEVDDEDFYHAMEFLIIQSIIGYGMSQKKAELSKQAFTLFDKDGDLTIGTEELIALLRTIDPGMGESDASEAMALVSATDEMDQVDFYNWIMIRFTGLNDEEFETLLLGMISEGEQRTAFRTGDADFFAQRLSPMRLEYANRLFYAFDADKDANISLQEFQSLLLCLDPDLTEEDVLKTMLDSGADGESMTKPVFYVWVDNCFGIFEDDEFARNMDAILKDMIKVEDTNPLSPSRTAWAIRVFEHYDADASDIIEEHEMVELMQRLEPSVTRAEVRTTLKAAYAGPDGLKRRHFFHWINNVFGDFEDEDFEESMNLLLQTMESTNVHATRTKRAVDRGKTVETYQSDVFLPSDGEEDSDGDAPTEAPLQISYDDATHFEEHLSSMQLVAREMAVIESGAPKVSPEDASRRLRFKARPPLPAGLSVNKLTGAITGKPAQSTKGTTTHTIIVQNKFGEATVDILIKIKPIAKSAERLAKVNATIQRNEASAGGVGLSDVTVKKSVKQKQEFKAEDVVGSGGSGDAVAERLKKLQDELAAVKTEIKTVEVMKENDVRKHEMENAGADEGFSEEYIQLLKDADKTDLNVVESAEMLHLLHDEQNSCPLVLWVQKKYQAETMDMNVVLMMLVLRLDAVVRNPFSVVYVHASPSPEFGWCNDVRQLLPNKYRTNLQRFVIVEPNFGLKVMVGLFRPFINFPDNIYLDNVEDLCGEFAVSKEFWPSVLFTEEPVVEDKGEVCEPDPQPIEEEQVQEAPSEDLPPEMDKQESQHAPESERAEAVPEKKVISADELSEAQQLWADVLFKAYDVQQTNIDLSIDSFVDLLINAHPDLTREQAVAEAHNKSGVLDMKMTRRGFNVWFAETFGHLSDDELEVRITALLATAPIEASIDDMGKLPTFGEQVVELVVSPDEEEAAAREAAAATVAEMQVKMSEAEQLQLEIQNNEVEIKKQRLTALREEIKNIEKTRIKNASPRSKADAMLKDLDELQIQNMLGSDEIISSLEKLEASLMSDDADFQFAVNELWTLEDPISSIGDPDSKKEAETKHESVTLLLKKKRQDATIATKTQALDTMTADVEAMEDSEEKEQARERLALLRSELGKIEAASLSARGEGPKRQCSSCGNSLMPDAKFCRECGEKVPGGNGDGDAEAEAEPQAEGEKSGIMDSFKSIFTF